MSATSEPEVLIWMPRKMAYRRANCVVFLNGEHVPTATRADPDGGFVAFTDEHGTERILAGAVTTRIG